MSLRLKAPLKEAPYDLNVLDFSTSNTILNNRGIKHDFQNKNKMWYLIPNLILEKWVGLLFCCNAILNLVRFQLD